MTTVPRLLILRALRPFIEAVRALPDYTPEDATITVTVGDCRALSILADLLTDIPQPSSPKVHPKADRFLATLTGDSP